MSRKEREDPEPEPEVGDSPFLAGLGRDELPSEDPDRQAQPEPALEGAASRFFSSLDARLGALQDRAQNLIDRLNESRKEDHGVLSGFRDSLLLKVSGLAEQLEERLFQLYGLHNERIQARLQDLGELLERLGRARDELRQVCRSVEAAYRDLCLQHEA